MAIKYEVRLGKTAGHPAYFLDASSVVFAGLVVLYQVLFQSDQRLDLLDVVIDLRVVELQIRMAAKNLFLVLFLLDLLVHGQLDAGLHSLLAFFVELVFEV